MMILSSFGFSSTKMRGDISEALKNHSGKMLIIPLATTLGVETGMRERNYALMAGFKEEDILVFDEDKPEELLDMDFGFICVLGGNTFKLLRYVKKYRLDSFIKQQYNKGAVYLGFSAGAYLACPDIRYVTLLEDNNHITDDDFSALALTDKYVLCHYDYRGMEYLKMCRSFLGSGCEIITINNDEMIIL